MKTELLVRFWAVACLLWSALSSTHAAAAESFARIQSVRIEKANIVVEIEASTDFTKVTLESSTRVGRRAWEPRAVKVLDPLDGLVARVTFTVPVSPAIEILRVRGDLAENTLPAEFYSGTNKFSVVNNGNANAGGLGGGVLTSAPTEDRAVMDGGGGARSVVESDIWKIEGDTLFFFNQYRGLQVIDVANPDAPVVTGTYDLAGAGEQMYVINGTNVVLLARDNCSWYGGISLRGDGLWYGGSDGRIVLLQIRDGVPHLVKELPVPGSITESRMVGSALYVVANSYQPRTVLGSESWEWGSEVLSFDLGDFATAQEKSRDWVSGYGNVVMATDKFLFVAHTDYQNAPPYTSTVHCYDISSPTGAFTKQSSFNAGGMVLDKFKMHVNGNTFVAVVQIDTWASPVRRSTYVNTFSLDDPRAPRRVGSLKVIENETLFATRFHGDLLYAVTFFVIDPLWIIDLSDPAAPKKVGELHIPGWSTYLHPLGDKLLAIGRDQTNGSSRTSVQLFDVANPANPSLLSKVLIGDHWSYSEANWDEKAFGVLPEDKLVLVPFYSSGSAGGYFEGVQLIDLESDRLVKRGVVEHNMGARRATLHRDRLLSISSRELLSVNVTDRDKPVVVADRQLSWAADRVHLAGDFVIEIEASGSTGPALRVVNANDPSVLRSVLQLTNLPYMGSIDFGGKLYVLQGRGIEHIYPAEYNPTNYFPIATNPAVYHFSEYDLSALPELRLAASTSKEGTANYFYGQYQPLRVRPDLLVWANNSQGNYWWGPFIGGPVSSPGVGVVVDFVGRPGIIGPWWGGASGHFIAVDLSGATPSIASEATLSGTNGWWSFSDAFTANGLVYTSHQLSEFDPTFDPPPYTYQDWMGTNWITRTNDPAPGSWVTRYYMDVIDFKDAADPLVRKPVNIPGSLIGLHRGGEMVYTRGSDFVRHYYSNDETLAASSYDGVNARLVTTLVLNQNWPRPTLADSGYVYIGSPGTTNNTNATIQVWTVSNAGKFEQVHSEIVPTPAQQFVKIDDMLVAQAAQIELYDARNPADLTLIGAGNGSVCYGLSLDAADGEISRGLWVPVGWYGVVRIPVGARP